MDEYTVVLYARVSTDDKGQTNETQIREMREYCKRHGYIIADRGEAVYTDEKTAKNDKRPGFREMKGRITEGDIDYVIARNQDRISREPQDYQNFLAFCKGYRVRVRFTDNDSKPETPEGVLFDSIQAGLAKADNMKRSINTKKGMETARLNGKHCGRMLAFAFTDEVDELRNKIQTTGQHRTVIMSVDTVMDLASKGYSVGKAAELMGISREALLQALKRNDLYEEYRQLASRQGLVTSRVENDGDAFTSRDGDVDA